MLEESKTSDLAALFAVANAHKKAMGWTWLFLFRRSGGAFEYGYITNSEVMVSTQTSLKSKLAPCPPCQDAGVKESTFRVLWQDSACDIKHWGAHKGSLWFYRRLELFSHLVSWLHPSLCGLTLVWFTRKTCGSWVNSLNFLVLSLPSIPRKRMFETTPDP